ncbi:cytidyltransferase [Clostridia bacterium]|nr:cytidyltransferase [Clostridia bacterium]
MYDIGYTTGVFDLFHIGHLNILCRAKEQCSYLIVGVSTDELVMEYKQKIPVIPFSERAAIVEAVRYVDKVVPQRTMDKLSAWETLKYNAIFHGDDWKGTSLYDAYAAQFKALGVDVVFLPHTEGTSSTLLSKHIKLF